MDFFLNSTIIVLLAFIGSLANYIYQVLCNRNLSEDEFGLLNTLISLITVLLVITPIATQWLTKVFSEIYVKKLSNAVKPVLINYYRTIGILLLSILIVYYFLQDYILAGLKLRTHLPMLYSYIIITLGLSIIPLNALLDGLNFFIKKSIGAFSNNLAQLIFTGIFVFIGFSFDFALIAKILAITFSLVVLLLFNLKVLNQVKQFPPSEPTRNDRPDSQLNTNNWGSFFKVGLGTISFVILINIDMVLARINLTPYVSGQYATVAVFGKALFFFATFNMQLFYVKCNECYHQQISVLPLLRRGFLYATALVIIGFTGLYIFIEPFLSLLNPSYSNVLPLVLQYAISILPYVYIQFLVVLLVAYNRYKIFILLLGLVIGQILTLLLYGQSISDFIGIRLYSGILILLILLIYSILDFLHQKVHR